MAMDRGLNKESISLMVLGSPFGLIFDARNLRPWSYGLLVDSSPKVKGILLLFPFLPVNLKFAEWKEGISEKNLDRIEE